MTTPRSLLTRNGPRILLLVALPTALCWSLSFPLLLITNDFLASIRNIGFFLIDIEHGGIYIALRYIVPWNASSPDLLTGFEIAALAPHGGAGRRCGRAAPQHPNGGRLKPKCSLAPRPSVVFAEIQAASAVPSQTFSAMPCRIGESDPGLLPKEERVQHNNQPFFPWLRDHLPHAPTSTSRKLIDSGLVPGPHIDVTGPHLEGPNPYHFMQMHQLTSAEDARRLVNYRLQIILQVVSCPYPSCPCSDVAPKPL